MSLDTKFYVVVLQYSTKALMFADEYRRLTDENKIIETIFHGTFSDLQDAGEQNIIKIISEVLQYPESLAPIIKHAKMRCESLKQNE